MAELARAHEIKVIYASVLPVHEYTPAAGDMFTQRPPEKIVALNRWLKNDCASSSVVPRTSCVYLDYFSAMVDDKGYMKKELADDGLHPNAAGYKIMFAPGGGSDREGAYGPSQNCPLSFTESM
jgi:lysophospholipase L1-like esterase